MDKELRSLGKTTEESGQPATELVGLGREFSCGFEWCCYNFVKGDNGNCVSRFQDVLSCFVDVDDMKETPLELSGGD